MFLWKQTMKTNEMTDKSVLIKCKLKLCVLEKRDMALIIVNIMFGSHALILIREPVFDYWLAQIVFIS